MESGARVAGRYDVIRELGRGAMARVYLALDTKFGAHIALKIAPALRANAYDEFKARFVREARIGYLLGRQDGFVRALDWGDLPGGDLYLAADLVPDAAPLDLRAGLRPVAERLGILLRAAELVGRVHAHGVVHRDVKPANFLVSGTGELFLTDFGLAKVLAERNAEQDILGYTLRTGRDVFMGTPQFMPPEQFENPAEVDGRADIYALGVMLFHCLTGRYPYEAGSGVEIICKHLSVRDGEESVPRPRDVDPRIDPILDDLCAAALGMDPDQRPATIAEFVTWLSRASEVDASANVVRPSFLAAMRRVRAPSRQDGPADTHRPSAAPLDSGRVIAEALDGDGFATRDTLSELRRRVGHDAFRGLLFATPAVVVENEREFQGGRWYVGRVGLLRRREGVNGPSDRINLGRSVEHADIVFELVTISNVQLQFLRRDDHWLVAETGSRNGTELNGVRLAPDQPVRLNDGDVLYLSKHLTLVFRGPRSLERWVQEQS